MGRRSDISGVCLILDEDFIRGREEDVLAQAARAGIRLFQYRNKRGTRREIYDSARRIAQAVSQVRGTLIINDHADIAKAVNAQGVHLGQEDLPAAAARNLLGSEFLIGISTHSLEQAIEAEADGADYIGFGPVFPTLTKDAGPVQGLDALRRIKNMVRIPVLAIGGMTRENAASVVQAGADGMAVISAVLKAGDVEIAAKELVSLASLGLSR